MVAEIVAVATEIDTALGNTLTAMLGAEARPALAIYSVLRAAHIQTAALMAAAEAVLDEETLILMEAVLQYSASAMADRHKLAHWHWGISDEHPDALLILHPERVREQRLWAERLMKRGSGSLSNEEAKGFLDYIQHVLVYREADLADVIDKLGRVRRAIARLHSIISPEPPPLAKTRDELLQELLAEPELAEALRHCENRKKNKK